MNKSLLIGAAALQVGVVDMVTSHRMTSAASLMEQLDGMLSQPRSSAACARCGVKPMASCMEIPIPATIQLCVLALKSDDDEHTIAAMTTANNGRIICMRKSCCSLKLLKEREERAASCSAKYPFDASTSVRDWVKLLLSICRNSCRSNCAPKMASRT